MKTLLISFFLIASSSIFAQNVASNEASELKPVKSYENVEVKSVEKIVAATDKKKYYSVLKRSVSLVKNEEKL